jgi:hypothetical protein
MKAFSRTSLPESIKYNGRTYTRVNNATDFFTGEKFIAVNVLSRNLRGKLDAHGKPYRATNHIFRSKHL